MTITLQMFLSVRMMRKDNLHKSKHFIFHLSPSSVNAFQFQRQLATVVSFFFTILSFYFPVTTRIFMLLSDTSLHTKQFSSSLCLIHLIKSYVITAHDYEGRVEHTPIFIKVLYFYFYRKKCSKLNTYSTNTVRIFSNIAGVQSSILG